MSKPVQLEFFRVDGDKEKRLGTGLFLAGVLTVKFQWPDLAPDIKPHTQTNRVAQTVASSMNDQRIVPEVRTPHVPYWVRWKLHEEPLRGGAK